MKFKNKTARLCALLSVMLFSMALSAQPLTKVFRNEALKEVLKEIETQTGLSIIYRNSDLNENKLITASFHDTSLPEVMDAILDSDLQYSIQSNILVISKKATSANSVNQVAQGKTIRGKVIDEKGEPVIGATITVKGTSRGTITDYDGNYALENVSDADVISISYLGYVSQEFPTTSSALSNITLKEDRQLLGEVVVIGYGSTRKEDLSMAVSTIKLDENMKSRPSNLTSMIQGSLPGVTIQANGGDPMAQDPVNINIRGRGSRGNDKVLYVVDGVPDAPFNVQDIETITVLKDAASAAIYGSTVGSGGVIMITTKQAKEGKISLTANIYTGFKKASNLPKTLTAEQFNQVNQDAFNLAGIAVPDIFNPEKYPYGNVTRTDWIKEIFRTAPVEHYSLSLSGGSKTVKSLVSASYAKEQGVLLNTFNNRLGIKADVSFQLTDWLRIAERGTYEYSNGQGRVNTTSHEGVLMSAIFYPRSATIYEFDESGKQLFDEFNNPIFGGTIPAYLAKNVAGYGEVRNPVATLRRLRQNQPSNRIFSTTTLEIKPIRNLTIKSDFTAGAEIKRYEDFKPRVPEVGRPDSDNSRTIENSYKSNWLWETTASYSDVFADKHYLSAMAGYTMSYDNFRFNSGTLHDFAREDKYSTIWSTAKNFAKTAPQEEIWDESMISALARVGYSFDDRYFFTGSIRRDATSKLWRENNYGYFPAVSAAWKISSEPFFADYNSVINLLKIRGSWGEIGNNGLIPRYPFNVPLEQAPDFAYFGKDLSTAVKGSYLATIVNRYLTWERTQQTGLGIDLSLFKNRFEFSVDYYNKSTKRLIEEILVPQTSGKPKKPYGNIGNVVNKGWEFSGKYNQSFNKIEVGLFANMSTVKNEVLNLGTYKNYPHEQHVNNMFFPLYSVVGQPWYSYYLLKTNGIFQTQDEVDSYLHTNPETGAKNIIQPNARPGDFKFVDANKDGKIDENDRQFFGSYLPKMTYGFGGSVSGFGFDFSLFFQGVSGSKIYNGLKQMSLSGRGGSPGYNMTSDVLKSWNYDKNSGYPILGIVARKITTSDPDPQKNLTVGSDFFLESGDYLRLRNITLGYTLPKSVMSALSMPDAGLRFYISGENVATFTKYSGITPEVGNNGIDNGTYPVSSVWNFGLNFNF